MKKVVNGRIEYSLEDCINIALKNDPNIKIGNKYIFSGLKQYFDGNYRFVDAWVLMNFILQHRKKCNQ